MDAQHTPGPWSAITGDLIRVHRKGDPATVAGVHKICGNRDLAIANARLIAASPEMLAALKLVVAPYAGEEETVIARRIGMPQMLVIRQARGAIAKAEGRS